MSANKSLDEYHVIHDCDTGSDDAIALMMLLNQNCNHNLVAITSVVGNTKLKNVKINNLRLVKLFGKLNEIPVYAGCSKPMVPVVPVKDADSFHGSDGMGGEPDYPPASSPALLDHLQSEEAVNAIIRLSKRYSGSLKIVATGPLTNIAMAARLDPELPSRVHSLHIMGGSLNGFGNSTAAAEFNFHYDPEAVFVVLQEFLNKCPIYVVPFEYTVDHALPFSLCDAWLGIDTEKAGFAKMALQPLYNWSKKNTPEGISICDAYTMALALDPSIGDPTTVTKVNIELAGFISRGFLAVDHSDLEKNFFSVNTYTTFNMDKFYQMLVNAVK